MTLGWMISWTWLGVSAVSGAPRLALHSQYDAPVGHRGGNSMSHITANTTVLASIWPLAAPQRCSKHFSRDHAQDVSSLYGHILCFLLSANLSIREGLSLCPVSHSRRQQLQVKCRVDHCPIRECAISREKNLIQLNRDSSIP